MLTSVLHLPWTTSTVVDARIQGTHLFTMRPARLSFCSCISFKGLNVFSCKCVHRNSGATVLHLYSHTWLLLFFIVALIPGSLSPAPSGSVVMSLCNKYRCMGCPAAEGICECQHTDCSQMIYFCVWDFILPFVYQSHCLTFGITQQALLLSVIAEVAPVLGRTRGTECLETSLC